MFQMSPIFLKPKRPRPWEFEYFDYGRCGLLQPMGLSLLGGGWNRKETRDVFVGFLLWCFCEITLSIIRIPTFKIVAIEARLLLGIGSCDSFLSFILFP